MPLDVEAVRRRLPGRRIEYFSAVDSTMHAAALLAAEGCASGTVVVADEQRAGQGRHGHTWHSEAGQGIYCSVVLRLPLCPEELPVLTLALGLAVSEAVARVTDLKCDLRWPNDVMLGGRKVCGILVQLHDSVAVAGIGVNVNHAGFPPELAGEATSLRAIAGRSFSREKLLAALLVSVDSFANMLVKGGRQAVIGLFSRASSYARGKRVTVALPEGEISGVTAGLDPAGFLVVRKDDGTDTLILAGGVRATGA